MAAMGVFQNTPKISGFPVDFPFDILKPILGLANTSSTRSEHNQLGSSDWVL